MKKPEKKFESPVKTVDKFANSEASLTQRVKQWQQVLGVKEDGMWGKETEKAFQDHKAKFGKDSEGVGRLEGAKMDAEEKRFGSLSREEAEKEIADSKKKTETSSFRSNTPKPVLKKPTKKIETKSSKKTGADKELMTGKTTPLRTYNR